MTQLEIEMLANMKDTLVALHGTKTTRDCEAYDRAIHDGCDPEDAWRVFSGTLRTVDVWTELEDVDVLLDTPLSPADQRALIDQLRRDLNEVLDALQNIHRDGNERYARSQRIELLIKHGRIKEPA